MTPPGRGRGHSADDVARAALRILDDDGLADLTMRRLATRLDVQPSALYWHFPNKQSLLAELSDRIVAQAASLLRGSGVAAEARALRDALLAFVLGHVWHEQQRLQYDSVGVVTPGAARPPEADFLFGVDLIHRGLHATAPRPA